MSYKLTVPETDVFGDHKYQNDKGHTECVVFIQQATAAPGTSDWSPGKKVSDAKPGEIARGTAIATFDAQGNYPSDALGRHAAIYLLHDKNGIHVLDQWNSQGQVLPRVIRFKVPGGTRRSNDGNTFYVIE